MFMTSAHAMLSRNSSTVSIFLIRSLRIVCDLSEVAVIVAVGVGDNLAVGRVLFVLNAEALGYRIAEHGKLSLPLSCGAAKARHWSDAAIMTTQSRTAAIFLNFFIFITLNGKHSINIENTFLTEKVKRVKGKRGKHMGKLI